MDVAMVSHMPWRKKVPFKKSLNSSIYFERMHEGRIHIMSSNFQLQSFWDQRTTKNCTVSPWSALSWALCSVFVNISSVSFRIFIQLSTLTVADGYQTSSCLNFEPLKTNRTMGTHKCLGTGTDPVPMNLGIWEWDSKPITQGLPTRKLERRDGKE